MSDDVIRDPPCPMCKVEGEWHGPDSTVVGVELHDCTLTKCPVTTFEFDQEKRTYEGVNVVKPKTRAMLDRWDRVSITGYSETDDDTWSQIRNEH